MDCRLIIWNVNQPSCGNNITLLLELIQKNHIKCGSIILAQDATMQYRMTAALKKYAWKG